VALYLKFVKQYSIYLYFETAVVVVIEWWLDLQLPVPPMPITSKVSSNSVHGEVYSIQHCMINFVSDLGQVGRCPPPIKLTDTI
jgi:hypothetical protein